MRTGQTIYPATSPVVHLYPQEISAHQRIVAFINRVTSEMSEGGECRNIRADEHHAVFALLYFFTIGNWAKFGRQSDVPEFFEVMIEKFYDLYERYVVFIVCEDLRGGREPECPPHWAPYFAAADIYRERPRPINRARMIHQAARAHVCTDLATALVQTFDQVPDYAFDTEKRARVEAAFLGVPTNGIFIGAGSDFLRELDNYLVGSPHSLGRRIARVAIGQTRLLWIGRFRKWRDEAWKSATESLSKT